MSVEIEIEIDGELVNPLKALALAQKKTLREMVNIMLRQGLGQRSSELFPESYWKRISGNG